MPVAYEKDGHNVQLAEPISLLKYPALHTSHGVSDPVLVLYVPFSHCKQVEVPLPVLYFPIEQLVHDEDVFDPTNVLNFPDWQREHFVFPRYEENDPDAQISHALEAGSWLYFPAEQLVHPKVVFDPISVLNVPG
jgi:hypothetical protein